MVELSQIAGVFSIDLLERGEILSELLVERAREPGAHEEPRACREETDDDREQPGNHGESRVPMLGEASLIAVSSQNESDPAKPSSPEQAIRTS